MSSTDNFVLPRPVERLPEYASARARQSLAEKIVDTFGLSAPSANAIANAVVDPSEVRKFIGEPTDPDVEKIPVPGGTLLGIRTSVWSRRIMPDPRNPRTLPWRRHPFAVEPGTGAEDSRFRPVPEPQSLNLGQPNKAELAVDIESQHHLVWASQQAANYVLAENNWTLSIQSQGVMEAVWLVATTYRHEDESPAVTTLTTAEGSSRITATHKLLKVSSADIPYDDNESKLRAHIRSLNTIFDLGADSENSVLLRCERVPALILVGFRPHPSGSAGFPTAVKSLVALRHVDPPKPWGEGPENESLADEVLDELRRQDLISDTQHRYFAGSCTRGEAKAAHLPDDPVLRAAQIVHLFTSGDSGFEEARRVAVTSQSTRKRLTQKLWNELATALILRAVADDPAKVDQMRRYLRHAFGKSVHRGAWQSTFRSTDQLVNEALGEVRRAISNGSLEEPGPSSIELAVRASYPLVVSGRLNADRGSASNDQPDRRTPGEVLEAMRRSIQGVHQLGQALRDYAEVRVIRAVGDDGQIRQLSDGLGDQPVTDIYLRSEFPPAGKAKSTPLGDTPTSRFEHALGDIAGAMDSLETALANLGKVVGEDGQPLVDTRGVGPHFTDPWRNLLSRMTDEMVVWSHTFRKAHGTMSASPQSYDAGTGEEDTDPYADVEDEELEWPHQDEVPEEKESV